MRTEAVSQTLIASLSWSLTGALAFVSLYQLEKKLTVQKVRRRHLRSLKRLLRDLQEIFKNI